MTFRWEYRELPDMGETIDNLDTSEPNRWRPGDEHDRGFRQVVFLVRDGKWPDADLGEKTVRRLFDLAQDVELPRLRYSNRVSQPSRPSRRQARAGGLESSGNFGPSHGALPTP